MFRKFLFQLVIFSALAIFFVNASAAQTTILPAETGNTGNVAAEKACKDYLEKHPGGNCGNYALVDFLVLAVNVSNWILGCVGALALLFFVYGGFTLILSAGSDEKVKQGKTILINAVIGLVIVFTSYIIIQFSMALLGVNGFSTTKPTSNLNKFFTEQLKKR